MRYEELDDIISEMKQKIDRYENGDLARQSREYFQLWQNANAEITRLNNALSEAHSRTAEHGLRIGKLLKEIEELKAGKNGQ